MNLPKVIIKSMTNLVRKFISFLSFLFPRTFDEKTVLLKIKKEILEILKKEEKTFTFFFLRDPVFSDCVYNEFLTDQKLISDFEKLAKEGKEITLFFVLDKSLEPLYVARFSKSKLFTSPYFNSNIISRSFTISKKRWYKNSFILTPLNLYFGSQVLPSKRYLFFSVPNTDKLYSLLLFFFTLLQEKEDQKVLIEKIENKTQKGLFYKIPPFFGE